MSTQERYKMVLNPRESARCLVDQAFREDRRKCARDYAAQVDASVDLYVTSPAGEELPVYATDAPQSADQGPVASEPPARKANS